MRRFFAQVVDSGPIALLAVISFSGSFTHIASLARASGQQGPMAYAVAVAVDLLCVVAAQEIRRDRRLGRSSAVPVLVLGIGVLLTLAANLADAQPTIWGRVCAGVPAGAFLLAMGLLERRGSTPVDEETQEVPEAPEAISAPPGQALELVIDDDLSRAQRIATDYQTQHGRRISRDLLRSQLGCSTTRATELLRTIRAS